LHVTELRVRTVRGRTIDPYRGTADDGDDERFAARRVEPQPIDDVVETLRALSQVNFVRAARRFTLVRGHERLMIAFASARQVSLDDVAVEGDPPLAILVFHALVPLFGPVELRTERFIDLIDGNEPAELIVSRYHENRSRSDRNAGAGRFSPKP
jgi:hypothetical protein